MMDKILGYSDNFIGKVQKCHGFKIIYIYGEFDPAQSGINKLETNV